MVNITEEKEINNLLHYVTKHNIGYQYRAIDGLPHLFIPTLDTIPSGLRQYKSEHIEVCRLNALMKVKLMKINSTNNIAISDLPLFNLLLSYTDRIPIIIESKKGDITKSELQTEIKGYMRTYLFGIAKKQAIDIIKTSKSKKTINNVDVYTILDTLCKRYTVKGTSTC